MVRRCYRPGVGSLRYETRLAIIPQRPQMDRHDSVADQSAILCQLHHAIPLRCATGAIPISRASRRRTIDSESTYVVNAVSPCVHPRHSTDWLLRDPVDCLQQA